MTWCSFYQSYNTCQPLPYKTKSEDTAYLICETICTGVNFTPCLNIANTPIFMQRRQEEGCPDNQITALSQLSGSGCQTGLPSHTRRELCVPADKERNPRNLQVCFDLVSIYSFTMERQCPGNRALGLDTSVCFWRCWYFLSFGMPYAKFVVGVTHILHGIYLKQNRIFGLRWFVNFKDKREERWKSIQRYFQESSKCKFEKTCIKL